jgi:hypothetical protein
MLTLLEGGLPFRTLYETETYLEYRDSPVRSIF